MKSYKNITLKQKLKINILLGLLILAGWVYFFSIHQNIDNDAKNKAYYFGIISSYIETVENMNTQPLQNREVIVIALTSYQNLIEHVLKNTNVESQFHGFDFKPEKDPNQIKNINSLINELIKFEQYLIDTEKVKSTEISQLVLKIKNRHEAVENLYNKQLASKSSHNIMLIGLLLLFTVVVMIISYKTQIKYIYTPIRDIYHEMEALGKGDLSFSSSYQSKDLMGKILGELKQLKIKYQNLTKFIESIGKGDYGYDLNGFNKEDVLSESLVDMKSKLEAVAFEDNKRSWANQGIATFSEILRKEQEDLYKLSDKIISRLIKYTNANQGAMFLLNEEGADDHDIEMISAYAWGQKKFINKKFGLKENLVGQAILEREYIYMTNVPDNFVSITSGLGEANPRSILIMPMMVNDVIYGAIELASFKPFEKHEIDFIKSIGESTASTISNIQITSNTKKLLLESQEMTEAMRAQEEELRQNAEELQSTQENLKVQHEGAKEEMTLNLSKIEAEKEKNIAILEGCVDGVITFGSNGEIYFVNQAAEEIWNVNRKEVIGNHIRKLLPIEFSKEGKILVYSTENGQARAIETRTEVNVFDNEGNEVSVLVTLSEGQLGNEITYAFFIQPITVELF